MSKITLLISVFLIFLVQHAPGDDSSLRSLKDLENIANESETQWQDAKIQWGDLVALRKKVVEEWSLHEVEVAAKNIRFPDWREVILERWGFLEAKSAVAYCLQAGIDNKPAYEAASRELEGGINGLRVQAIGLALNSALAGWSRKDPHAAWKAVVTPDGEIWNSYAFDGYGYLAPIEIFEHLARIDRDYALDELKRMPDGQFRGSMMKGISRGLPKKQDWKTLFTGIIEAPGSDHRDVMAVLRGSLFARWMEEDAEAAVKWFQSAEGKAISVEVREEFVGASGGDPFAESYDEGKLIKKPARISLAKAVRHWLSRDRDGAIEWLKNHQELVPEVIKGGSWLDPDDLHPKDLRFMLAKCLGDIEREKLLRSLIGKEGLENLLSRENQEELKKEIEELQLRYRFAKELFESHLRDEADPFGE